jgi:hypothetical protein
VPPEPAHRSVLGGVARSAWVYWPLWCATRALVVAMAVGPLRISAMDVTSDVSVIYRGWFEVLRSGTFPMDDVTWQYPPAAAVVIILPGALAAALGCSYLTGFLALVAAFDAAAAWLLRRASRGRRAAGAWYWLIGVPLLGPTVYARYDLVVTAVAVAALLLSVRRPAVGGALAGLGAMLKVWPVLTVLGLPRGRRFRDAVVACAASVLALGFCFAVAAHGAYAFLGFQENRGVEVESLGGIVFQIARAFGWPGSVSMNYGSLEFLGPGVGVVAKASVALTAAAFGWLLLWRWRARRWSAATPFDAALVALLLFTATSRVISPQYLVWLLGLAAVCLLMPGSSQRPVAWLLLPAAALTTVEFPVLFGDVVSGHPLGVVVLTVRNALLAVATLWGARRLWRATTSAPPTQPPVTAQRRAPQAREFAP